MKAFMFFALFFFIGIYACQSQNRNTIPQTINKVLRYINDKDYKNIQELIGLEDPTDTSLELIIGKVNRIDYLIDKYHAGKIDDFKPLYADQLDESSRLKVTIPLFDGYDPETGLLHAELLLYFGPPQVIPFNKLSGFEYKAEYNIERRKELLRNNQLPDMDTPR